MAAMRSEPVYQPTTTSLDAPSSGVVLGSAAHHHRGGVGGRSWLPPLTYDPLLTSSHGPKGSSWPRSLLLVLALLFAVMGLVMIIVGSTSYHALLVRTGEGINEGGGGGGDEGAEGKESGGGRGGGEEITADGTEGKGGGGGRGDGRAGNATAYILVLCLGILLEVAALGSLWAYCRYMGYYLPCWPGKISRIRRRLHAHNTRSAVFNGQMTSAGTPVSAQYCPPASPPLVAGGPGTGPGEHGPTRTLPGPPYTDGSEIEHLIAMEEEGKVELSDDTERIFDEDPRIVLTPLKNREEC